MRSNSTLTGIACGMGAGALWGLVLLTPEIARKFSPLELTIGRYIAYGLIALALILPRWPRLRTHLARRDWITLSWLSLAGNTAYYILLSNAVQSGGIAMTSLVIGFLPVAVTIIGSREQGAVPLKKLAPSLLFCAAGAVCIGWQALGHSADTTATGSAVASVSSTATVNHIGQPLIGFVCAIGALISWTSFAVGNRRALTRRHDISSQDWNLLTGVVTGLQSFVLIPVAIAIVMNLPQHQVRYESTDWLRFAGVSIGVAVFASILGNALWNRMSRLLPLTLVGQMIVFETLFALIYGFIWEWRLPTALEVSAFLLVILSVASCVRAHASGNMPA